MGIASHDPPSSLSVYGVGSARHPRSNRLEGPRTSQLPIRITLGAYRRRMDRYCLHQVTVIMSREPICAAGLLSRATPASQASWPLVAPSGSTDEAAFFDQANPHHPSRPRRAAECNRSRRKAIGGFSRCDLRPGHANVRRCLTLAAREADPLWTDTCRHMDDVVRAHRPA